MGPPALGAIAELTSGGRSLLCEQAIDKQRVATAAVKFSALVNLRQCKTKREEPQKCLERVVWVEAVAFMTASGLAAAGQNVALARVAATGLRLVAVGWIEGAGTCTPVSNGEIGAELNTQA